MVWFRIQPAAKRDARPECTVRRRVLGEAPCSVSVVYEEEGKNEGGEDEGCHDNLWSVLVT